MTHLPNLILDLGLILMAAAVITLIFRKLRQPVVLGYLIAGFLVGPNFHLLPTVRDQESIAIWGEIGVIFMLFGLGLEFSFRRLKQVGRSASITATIEIFCMLGFGYVAGQVLGWSKMDSVFLGAILSISSTTIIARAFGELGLKGRRFVSLVYGVLIVEDLIAILLLVLLSSVAAARGLAGTELVFTAGKLGFFLVLWFLLGIYLLPILLQRFRDLLSDETLLVVSIGLCLLMVILANKAGFSPALGAFVMGSILAETPKGRRVEELIAPVRDLFSAVFFVSVGMMISLDVLRDHFGIIIFITAFTIIGKFLSTVLGALVAGRSLKNAVQAGLSLAQIGEFSFIIATLGTSLAVTSSILYPIAVAVSALTTFATPYLIRSADPFYVWIESKLSKNIKESLSRYETAMEPVSQQHVLALVWEEYGMKTLINSVLVIAITLAVSRFALPRFGAEWGEEPWSWLACAIVFVLSAPFLWAVLVGGPSHAETYQAETAEKLRKLQIGVAIFRFLVGATLVAFIVSNFTSILALSGVLLMTVVGLGAILFSPFSESIYHKIEAHFISTLTENELVALEHRAHIPQLAPWNATLADFVISPDSIVIAKTLQEARLKESYGVTVTMIERGDNRILAPTRAELLLPGDHIFLIGTDEQIAAARKIIESTPKEKLPPLSDSFGLTSFVLLPSDSFVNRPISESGLREAVNGLVVGIERQGKRFLNPDSSMQLLAGDLVWIMGDRALVKALRAEGKDQE